MASSWIDTLRQRLTQDPRLARMLHGGLTGLAGRLFAVLISFFTLPLTVRYLGRQEYGLWITISTSVVMLSVLDLGIASTLTNFISRSFAREDRQQAQRAYATAFWITVGASCVLGMLAVAAFQLIDFGSLFRLAGANAILEARRTVAVSIAYFLISLPMNLVDRVLSGYQKVHIGNYFQILNSILSLFALLVAIGLHGSLLTLMIAYCSAMLAGGLLKQLWLSLHLMPWMHPHPGLVDRRMARALFGQGILFFLLQLTGLVVFNTDNLVITHYLGAAEVTPYSVAWRLISYATLLQTMLIPSFWPAFTEAYEKREMHWVRRTYRAMVLRVTGAVGAMAILMGLFGRVFIRLWAGPAAVPSARLLWTMAAWALVMAITSSQALLLTAVGRLRLETTVAVLAAMANLGFSVVLVQRIGSEGVIVATLASFAVFMLIPQQLEVRRILRGDFLPLVKSPAAKQELETLPEQQAVGLL